jgi:hypothetical protein
MPHAVYRYGSRPWSKVVIFPPLAIGHKSLNSKHSSAIHTYSALACSILPRPIRDRVPVSPAPVPWLPISLSPAALIFIYYNTTRSISSVAVILWRLAPHVVADLSSLTKDTLCADQISKKATLLVGGESTNIKITAVGIAKMNTTLTAGGGSKKATLPANEETTKHTKSSAGGRGRRGVSSEGNELSSPLRGSKTIHLRKSDGNEAKAIPKMSRKSTTERSVLGGC